MRGRPGRKPRFSSEDVLEAALEEGITTFTMAGVAARLGVRPAALYRVFDSREAIYDAAVARLVERGTTTTFDADTWQDYLRALGDAMWEMFEATPWLADAILASPDVVGGALPHIRRIVARLIELDIPGGAAGAAFATDLVGDMVILAYIGMRPYNARGEDGRTGMERFAQRAGGADPFGMGHMGPRGSLEAKIEFVIAALEAGVLVPGAAKAQRSPH